MSERGRSEHIQPPATTGPDSFTSIRAFLVQLANDNPGSSSGLLDFLVPETLIANGSGIRCSYSKEYGQGSVDILRPFAGAIFLLYTGRYDHPGLINEIAQRTTRDNRRYMVRMVLEGDISMRFGEDTVRITPGEALMYRFREADDVDLVTKPRQHHRYVHVIFTEDGLTNAARQLRIEIPSTFSASKDVPSKSHGNPRNFDHQALEHFAESLWLYSGPEHLRAQLLQLKVGELFCLLGDERRKEGKTQAVSLPQIEVNKLLYARKIVDENLGKPPSLSKLSSETGLNRRKLTEGFRTLFGMSIGEYGREQRHEFAYRLVMTGSLPIADIAEKCGYDQPANFTRAFTQKFGQSPTRLRRTVKASRSL